MRNGKLKPKTEITHCERLFQDELEWCELKAATAEQIQRSVVNLLRFCDLREIDHSVLKVNYGPEVTICPKK